MPYDEQLADRVRELLSGEPNLTEKRMFGGLAFLVDGNMAVAASGQSGGGLLVRVDPSASEDLVASTAAEPMVMRGRPMKAWLRVPPDEVRTGGQLAKWVAIGTKAARSLPPK